jgi:hypothetical protein
LVKPVRGGRSSVTCPVCSKETALPQGGVVSLQEAFYVSSLAEIQGTLEKVTEKEKDPIPSAPYREDLMPSVPLHLCSIHRKELDFYCETCGIVICAHCIVICAHCIVKQHRNHEYKLKDDEVSENREELLIELEPTSKELLRVLNDESRLIVDLRSSLEAKINVVIENSLQEMRSKKASLINEVYRNAREMLQKRSAMKKHVQGELASLRDQELLTKDQVDATKTKMTACIQEVAESKIETADLLADEDSRICVEFTTAQVGNANTIFRLYPL